MKLKILFLLAFLSVELSSQTRLVGTANQISTPAEKTIGNAVRLNFTTQFLTPPDERFGQVTLSPTWQGFALPDKDMDRYMKQLSDSGLFIMGNVLNGFNKKYPLPLKALPKNNVGLSSDDTLNFSIYRKICEQLVLRYGHVKNDALIDIAEYSGLANGSLFWKQIKVSGLGYMDALQILNELNNTWVSPASEGRMTGKQYAHLLRYISNGVWRIDPKMILVTAPTAGWSEVWINDMVTTWEANYGAFPHYNPKTNTGIILSFNNYLPGCSYGNVCRTPEPITTIIVKSAPIQSWLKSHNAFAFITEHGCNSEYKFDIACYDYPGLDKYQDQARFLIESTDTWLNKNETDWRIIGSFVYQGKDDPNEPRFGTTGILFSNSELKPTYNILKSDWSTKYPEFQFVPTPDDTIVVPPPATKDTIFLEFKGEKYFVPLKN